MDTLYPSSSLLSARRNSPHLFSKNEKFSNNEKKEKPAQKQNHIINESEDVNGFEKLGLAPQICKAVADSGYTSPTPIQLEAIPELINGRDVFASADTGTGKTAAFMLPALQKLMTPSTLPGKGPRVLVLTPTRELASQINNATKNYGKLIPRIKTVNILGGMPYEPQCRDLRHYVDIVVATPGRLLDHTREGRIDYSRVELFVLDEADRMLDMGFIDDVKEIAKQLPAERQTVLFSATLKRVATLANKLTKNPKTIQIAQSENTNDNVEQQIIFANDESHKRKLLTAIFERDQVSQAIVFSATKMHTEKLADELDFAGITATAIHGDLRQRSREAIIRKLRANRFQVLVATDVASRGIDVPGLSHVINYDLPRTAEDYTHRIGRTGRAGAKGIAITIVTNSERHRLRMIERDLGHKITEISIPGMEAKKFEPNTSDRGSSRRNGSGRSRGSSGSRRQGSPGRSFGGADRGDRGRGKSTRNSNDRNSSNGKQGSSSRGFADKGRPSNPSSRGNSSAGRGGRSRRPSR